MQVEVDEVMFSRFSATDRKVMGWSTDTFTSRYGRSNSINLYSLKPKQLDLLSRHLIGHKDKLTNAARAAIKRFRTIQEGKDPKASNAKSMTDVMTAYLALKARGYRLYRQIGDAWFSYFVVDVEYIPERKQSDYYEPAKVAIRTKSVLWGEANAKTFLFETSLCRGRTAPQLLATDDLHIESPEIREHYIESRRKFRLLMPQVGLQCTTMGVGFALHDDGRTSADMSQTSTDIRGCPTNVVIDLPADDEDNRKNRRDILEDHQAWSYLSRFKKEAEDRDDDDVDEESDIDDLPNDVDSLTDTELDLYDIGLYPVHPLIPVFDLRRHERYCVNALDLNIYEYDKAVGEKLILPADHKRILDLLVRTKGDEFQDIVQNKSGGTTVLLAGKPGLGKTLSAEVFAEVTERPLYRVQCSQLGVDPDTIETELKGVFDRANRWNAVILLDEADLYIARRENDLDRNAIVCVFLQVLEYQAGVLFLTTNMPQTVDDAIASRCIARIDMLHPTLPNLELIWKTLVESSGINLSPDDYKQLAARYPKMGGRDVKSAIKLSMVHSGKGQVVTREQVEFILKFHPNRGDWGDPESLVESYVEYV